VMATIIRELEPINGFGNVVFKRFELRCQCGKVYQGASASQMCSECEAAEEARRERERAQRSAEQRLQSTVATIPPKYVWASFDSDLLPSRVKPSSAIARASSAADSLAFVLLGGAGTGKTSLACAMLRQAVLSRGARGRFVDTFALAKARQEHPLGEGEAPAIEQAVNAKLLLLDELGAEFARNTAVQEVIHERHANELPTIYTSGFGADELAKRYGDGIARRIFEGATVIRLGNGGAK
jgi:DNA replication protein DnaC